VDGRTADLLDALKHPGGVFLLCLLDGPATEAGLISRASTVSHVDQSTANRRLSLLQRAGLVEREDGNRNAPGRRWRLTQTVATGALLAAALELSEAVAEAERKVRADAKKVVTGRRHLRSVK
jgi:DNA-binding MarR family transcriptional regulator